MSKRMRLIQVMLISVMFAFSGIANATIDTGADEFPVAAPPTVHAPPMGGTPPAAPPAAGPHFPMATPPPPPPVAAGPSINPAAAQGQASQNGGAGANNAAGAALIAAGAAMMANPPTVPIGAMLMAMGMLALAQGSHDNNAANQSGATYAASVNGNTNPSNPALGNGTAAYTNPDVAKAQAALADAGYSMTPNGLTTPTGSTIPNSAFNSPDAMAKAGIDPNHIAAIQKALADVNGSAGKVSSMAMSEGSGGYSAKGGSGSGSSSIHFANPFNLNSAQKGQMIAGKTVLFDGDPIGVRGQNIFQMVHERYEKRRQTNDFIENDAGAVADVRAPASVKPPVFSKLKPK